MSWLHLIRISGLLALSILIVACQQPAVRPAPPPPPPPVATAFHRDTASAVEFLARAVAQQLAPVAKPQQTTVPVDEFFSVQSAEVSTSGRALQRDLATDPLTLHVVAVKIVGNDREQGAQGEFQHDLSSRLGLRMWGLRHRFRLRRAFGARQSFQ